MAEINENKSVKVIAFYLPQFHTIPENDKWWGEGFTEWTNTKKATPLFEGHYQPKTPLNENYYNLLDDDVMYNQSKLAQKYGVWGFCYYHYWFKNGKKLLEKPIEKMLNDSSIDIPFCLSWANENWTRNWDGGNKEIMIEQDYGNKEDWKKHYEYLKSFFKDKRYITIDGHPLFVIYKPQLIENLNEMLKYWNDLAIKDGIGEIYFAYQFPAWFLQKDYDSKMFKYIIKFEPTFSGITMNNKNIFIIFLYKLRQFIYKILKSIGFKNKCQKCKKRTESKLRIYDYDEVWNKIINGYREKKMILGAFTAWDNTARNKNGIVFHESTPQKFGNYMHSLIEKVKKQKKDRMIFINAWNEWAEGAYLEPDQKFKYEYLEQLNKALSEENVRGEN